MDKGGQCIANGSKEKTVSDLSCEKQGNICQIGIMKNGENACVR